MTENWKDIPGYPGYSVSDAGNVRGPKGPMNPKVPGKRGHLSVQLYLDDGTRHTRYIHKLVAQVFLLGGRPCPDSINVHHINHNKLDNRVDNLEILCAIKHRSHHTRGEDNPNAKLTSEQVAKIRKYGRAGMPHAEIASKYKLSVAMVSMILANTNWKEEG
jgi:hypothetical protein